MIQTDMFDETLEKKILRMEKWIGRLQKEVWFLKEVYHRTQPVATISTAKKVEQLNFFGT